LIPLLLLASPGRPASTADAAPDPQVRVSFNQSGRYLYGDKARVYVQAARDGYVVVLRSDARGTVRVLSPLDPDDDQQVHGGKRYEAKGRGGREAFVVEDTSGQGLVVAAWSAAPFDLRRFDRGGRWDVQALADTAGGLATTSGDAQARLLGLLNAMSQGGRYRYDAATYVVYSPRLARAGFGYPSWFGYPYGFGWGGWWGYDPWWGGPAFGPRVVVLPERFGFRRAR
jgi:hypothetical protein